MSMHAKIATRETWQNKELPNKRRRLDFCMSLSAADFERVQAGLIPQVMDDKWFAFFEDDCLYVHRSWTGFCIYAVRFAKHLDSWVSAEIWVNRDKNQYKNKDEARDIDMLRLVFNKLMGVKLEECNG